jgi:hypothetical protein
MNEDLLLFFVWPSYIPPEPFKQCHQTYDVFHWTPTEEKGAPRSAPVSLIEVELI